MNKSDQKYEHKVKQFLRVFNSLNYNNLYIVKQDSNVKLIVVEANLTLNALTLRDFEDLLQGKLEVILLDRKYIVKSQQWYREYKRAIRHRRDIFKFLIKVKEGSMVSTFGKRHIFVDLVSILESEGQLVLPGPAGAAEVFIYKEGIITKDNIIIRSEDFKNSLIKFIKNNSYQWDTYNKYLRILHDKGRLVLGAITYRYDCNFGKDTYYREGNLTSIGEIKNSLIDYIQHSKKML